ncbi:MAG: cbb3-type cytochrome c oxidase subunit I [Desulfococcaceae bacterium]|nr:cbb3-type cytochrome c oxidase subunit I [Desulfococcaceae bacterium]
MRLTFWRWWVVHLWVEGFFEVFATVVMAFLLSRIGAVSRKFALMTVNFTIFLYLGGGVIGTFHHLYWSGSPIPIIALGAVFSALEVVPLTLLGFEIVHNLKVVREGGQAYAYKWPVYFFVSVAFWNLVGAGVFGFLINPPIVLYYAQGINTTPIHSHTALFGVYGMLGHLPAAFFRAPHCHPCLMVGSAAEMEFLGTQRRTCLHGRVQPDSLRLLSTAVCHQIRSVVCQKPGNCFGPGYPCLKLGAGCAGYNLCRRSHSAVCLSCKGGTGIFLEKISINTNCS